jgi:hypothetical protein
MRICVALLEILPDAADRAEADGSVAGFSSYRR